MFHNEYKSTFRPGTYPTLWLLLSACRKGTDIFGLVNYKILFSFWKWNIIEQSAEDVFVVGKVKLWGFSCCEVWQGFVKVTYLVFQKQWTD